MVQQQCLFEVYVIPLGTPNAVRVLAPLCMVHNHAQDVSFTYQLQFPFPCTPQALHGLLHANTHQAFLYTISHFDSSEPTATKAAFARALCVIAAACAEPVGPSQWSLRTILRLCVTRQEVLSVQTRDLATFNNEAMTLLSSLPEQLSTVSSATGPFRNMLTDLVSSGSTFEKEGTASSEDVLRIGLSVKSSSTDRQAMLDKIAELLALHQTDHSSLTGLPNTVAATIKAAQQTRAELLAHTVSRKDLRTL